MNQVEEKTNMENLNSSLLDDAIKDAIAKKSNIVESETEMVKRVYDEFIMKKVKTFPMLCKDCYQANRMNNKFLEDYGNKGKYTESYGWSKDGTMKHNYLISKQLKHFMENLVYRRFWEEDNARIRDWFMEQVCAGGTTFDYEQLLKVVVAKYGQNLTDACTERAPGSVSLQ